MAHQSIQHPPQRHEHLPQGDSEATGLSLLFRPGERPTAETIVHLIEAAQATGLLARVSHLPDPAAGWLEVLASGLTFDLRALAPAAPAPRADVHHMFGFGSDEDGQAQADYEAIELVPSGHIAAGAGLQPVVRTMMGLAANLALNLPVAAIHWQPAHTLMPPGYFARMVLNWLAGGAFPALGLTALVRAGDGSVASRGLAHFTGQEMQLQGKAGESPAETLKLAVRVVDHLVRVGRLAEPLVIGAGTQALVAEPSRVGKLVLVWREAP